MAFKNGEAHGFNGKTTKISDGQSKIEKRHNGKNINLYILDRLVYSTDNEIHFFVTINPVATS